MQLLTVRNKPSLPVDCCCCQDLRKVDCCLDCDIMGVLLPHHHCHHARVRLTPKDAGKGEQNVQDHAVMISHDNQQHVPCPTNGFHVPLDAAKG